MEDKNESLKEVVYRVFDRDYIIGITTLFHELLVRYYEKKHLEEVAYINEELVDQCVDDILIDLARLCDFHDIDEANDAKIYSYFASWVIKRKPFQLKSDENLATKYRFINEAFAVALIMEATDIMSTKLPKDRKNRLVMPMKSISYHLRYRNTDPKALLLLMNGIEAGIYCTVVQK